MIGLTTAKSFEILEAVKNYCATINFRVIRPRDNLYRSRGTHPTDRVS